MKWSVLVKTFHVHKIRPNGMVCNQIRQIIRQTVEDFIMMMIYKKILPSMVFIFLFVLSAGVAQAQRGNFSPEQMRERQESANKELISQLELSDEQTPKVTEILTAALDARIEMMADMRGGGGRGAMREKMAKMDEETTEKLVEVLSEDQMAKYKKILANRPRRGRGSVRPS